MSPERWQRIESLYYDALERPAHERDSWLAEVCAGDASLQLEVERLLEANDEASGFLETRAVQLAARSLAAETPTRPLSARVGQQLSHYQVLSRIGAGGMGEVYLARDTHLERRVALKLLPLAFIQDPERLQRFIREAKAASALNHPNIITIYEIGVVSEAELKTHFIATEYIEGVTLRAWQPDEDQRLNQVIELGIQIASALDAAHQAGIVHRDIKPENLMVRPDGLVKVLDFGLAKLTAAHNSGANQIDTGAQTLAAEMKTTPGTILGTLRYMSPEQARGRSLDARTDIFSLGVVLYELLTRQPLFAGESNADVIAAILHKEPAPLGDYLPEVPAELERILRKALAKDSRDRYQNVADLQIDLRSLKQDAELSARMLRSGQTASSSSKSLVSASQIVSRRAMWVLPLVFLAGLALWWAWGGRFRQVKAPPVASLKPVEVMSWQSALGEGSGQGAFSPDGKWVAFTSTKGGNRSIWVKQAATGDAEQSTKDEFNNSNPIWSPNGEELAYISLREGQVGIWRKPLFGGSPALIKAMAPTEGNIQLRKWSQNGATIYYELFTNLFALDLASGVTKQLTNLGPAKAIQYSFSVAPTEQHIAYLTSSDKGSLVWVAPLQGGAPRQLAALPASARKTAWHADSERVFFGASVEGIYQLFLTDLAGHQPVQLTFGERDVRLLDVSSVGAKVLYDSSVEDSDLWRVDLAKAEEFAVASDIGFEFWPDVSSDGRTVAYQSAKDISQGNKLFRGSIMTQSSSATDKPATLVKEGAFPRWSADGKRLAFARNPASGIGRSLWTIDTSSGEAKLLAKSTSAAVSVGTLLSGFEYTVLPYNRMQTSDVDWSLDGKLAYGLAINSQYNLWVTDADGSNNTQATNHTDTDLQIFNPLWSSDGQRIAYLSRSAKVGADQKLTYGLWICEVATRHSRNIFQENTFLRLLGWSQSGQELLFAKGQAGTSLTLPSAVSLVRISLVSGEQHLIAVLADAYLHNLHLAKDRRAIAFVARREGKDDVWVLPVTGGTPKKLTNNNEPRRYFSSLAWSPDGKAIYFGKQLKHNLLMMLTGFE